jgi:hypothetical protein
MVLSADLGAHNTRMESLYDFLDRERDLIGYEFLPSEHVGDSQAVSQVKALDELLQSERKRLSLMEVNDLQCAYICM